MKERNLRGKGTWEEERKEARRKVRYWTMLVEVVVEAAAAVVVRKPFIIVVRLIFLFHLQHPLLSPPFAFPFAPSR